MLIREESLWTTQQAFPLDLMEEKSQAAGCFNHPCGTSAVFWQSALHRPADLKQLRKPGSPFQTQMETCFVGHGLFWVSSTEVIFYTWFLPFQLSKTFSPRQTQFHIKSFGFVPFTQSPQALPTQAKSLLNLVPGVVSVCLRQIQASLIPGFLIPLHLNSTPSWPLLWNPEVQKMWQTWTYVPSQVCCGSQSHCAGKPCL